MVTMAKIVTQMKAHIARELFGNSADFVIVVADRSGKIARQPPLPNLNGDRDLLIHVRGFGSNQNVVAAGGRHNTQVRRVVDLVLRSRREVDQVSHDEKWLFDQWDYEDSVINLLQIWWGDPASVTAESELLMVSQGESARLINGGPEVRELFVSDGTWGSSILSMEFLYRMNLDLAASNQ